MPFVSDIIFNLESISELNKIIKRRESFYAFLYQVKENGKYSYLLEPFQKNNVIKIFEAKEFLNHLLEYIMASKYGCNYITYEKEDAEAIVQNEDPKSFHIIDNSTVAVFLENRKKSKSNKNLNLKKIDCLHDFSSPKNFFHRFFSFFVVFLNLLLIFATIIHFFPADEVALPLFMLSSLYIITVGLLQH